MKSEIEDYINAAELLDELNCEMPATFCFFPENLESAKTSEDFIYTDNTLTLRKLFKSNNLPEERLEKSSEKYRERCSIDWYAPTIFIGYTLWSQNPEMVSVGLNVLSNYVTDFFKGTFGKKIVKLEIVIEETPRKSYKKITYEGEPEGLQNLKELFKSLKK